MGIRRTIEVTAAAALLLAGCGGGASYKATPIVHRIRKTTVKTTTKTSASATAHNHLCAKSQTKRSSQHARGDGPDGPHRAGPGGRLRPLLRGAAEVGLWRPERLRGGDQVRWQRKVGEGPLQRNLGLDGDGGRDTLRRAELRREAHLHAHHGERRLAAGPGEVERQGGTVTYSIVACDSATGEPGVAVQSHWFAVGPWSPGRGRASARSPRSRSPSPPTARGCWNGSKPARGRARRWGRTPADERRPRPAGRGRRSAGASRSTPASAASRIAGDDQGAGSAPRRT